MDGKESFNDIMKFSRMTLQLLGVWPESKNEYLEIIHFIGMAVYLFSMVILAQTIQLIIIWGDLDAMSEILTCALLLILVAMTKMTCLWCYRKRMIKLLAFIIQDWNNIKTKEERSIMLEFSKFSRKISQIYILMAFSTSVARFFQVSYINADVWFTSYSNATRVLTVEAYFPFDWNYSPIFEIVYILDYTAALLGNLCNAGTDSLFTQIGFHYAAQFRILQLNVINITNTDGNSKDNFQKRLCYVIQKHEHINRCLGMLEDTFCFMLLVQLLSHSILFCVQGYQLILYLTDDNSKSVLLDTIFMILYLVYMLGNSYVYCYVSEILKEESFTLGLSAYKCEWSSLTPKMSRNILLIIQRSRRPVKFTAAKIYEMNMQKFGSILKTSMGYLSILLTMKKSHLNE